MAQFRIGLAIAAMGIGSVYACSPDGGSGNTDTIGNPDNTGGTGSRSADSGADGGAGDVPGTSGGRGNVGGGFNGMSGSPAGGAGGNLAPDAACESTVLQPEAIEEEIEIETEITCVAESPGPLSLYIMLDNSRSMEDNNKWRDAVDALTQFVQTDPAPAGQWDCTDQDGNAVEPPEGLPMLEPAPISVAIQYFHPAGVGNNPNECDGSGHEVPDVPMGTLPGNANAIIQSLAGTAPNDNTPTEGALLGGTRYCAQQMTQNPDEKCAVVLVTDGQPNGCNLDSSCGGGGRNCVDPQSEMFLTPMAANAFRDYGVFTFTVGMDGVTPEGFGLLNAIAIAGSSDCTPGVPGSEACNVSGAGSDGFLDALNTIRDSIQVTESSSETVTDTVTVTTTLPCQWDIPDAPDGKELDRDLVNVIFTSGGSTQEIGNVETEADCAAAGGGWHYDDLDPPETIHACPETCSVLERLTSAKVEVLFGCATKPADGPR